MSLQLFNDYNLDIKVRSIDSYVPIGGGGSIADNSIKNIKLFDKTIENTKIKDGTITSSLLDANLTIGNNLLVNNNLTVNGNMDAQNDLIVNNDLSVINNLIVNGNIDAQNGDLNVAGNISCTYDLTLVNGNLNVSVGDMNIINGSIYMNNGDINMVNGSISVGNYLTTSKLTLNNISDSSYKVTGTAQLNSGAVTVTTSAMNATSFVFLQYNNVVTITHLSALYVIKSNGSFQIRSRDSSDNNFVDWIIINPA